jgi:D-amino peptidase
MAKKLHFFISFDLEGVSGVTSWNEMKTDAPDFLRIRRSATAEVNAAVRGIRKSGLPVGEILICDAHGRGDNLLPDELERGVSLVRGAPRNYYMVEGLNEKFAAAFFIGYHAMVGTMGGLMDHTYSSSSIYNIRLNGRDVGETAINAAVCGHYGVPLALVSGDDRLAREVRSFFGPGVETITTKTGISRFAGQCRHPADVCREIEIKAERAALRNRTLKPFAFRPPIRGELDVMNTLIGHVISPLPGLERRSGRKFVFRSKNILDFYRQLMLICDLAGYANRILS